jgi:hypothetical protein
LFIGTTACTGKVAGTTAVTGTGIGFNEFFSSSANYLALISGGRGFKLFTFFSNAEKSPKGFA